MALSSGFIGSGRFAARCLEMISERVRPLWVITNTPAASGRGLKLQDTPVFETAKRLGLPVYTTERLSADAERIEWLKADTPDVILVIDFGQIIKEPVLSAAPLGCINIHPSKVPQYRGSAPIQRAIMDGLSKTAVSIFRLDAGMDTGPLLAQPELEISQADTSSSLSEKAAALGCAELLRYICEVPAEEWRFIPQSEEGASLAPKIEKSEGKIDWERESARRIADKVRGIGENPGVFCMLRGKRLRIRSAECAEDACGEAGSCEMAGVWPMVFCAKGALVRKEVQPEGKKTVSAADWARGARLQKGERFA